MKVYIVQHVIPYEGEEIEAIFQTRNQADEYLEKQGRKPYGYLVITEWEVN